MQLFAKFLKKLASTPDGDGSLLDHSMLFYGSGMSNSDIHSPIGCRWSCWAAGGRREGQSPSAGAGRHAPREPPGRYRQQVRRRHQGARREQRTVRDLNPKINVRRPWDTYEFDIQIANAAARALWSVGGGRRLAVTMGWLAGRVSAAGASDIRVVNAVKAGDRSTLQKLTTQRADVNAAEPDGTTALHWTVRADDLDTTRLLVRGGSKRKAANRYGVTPTRSPPINGNAAVIELLLKAGADPNTTMRGKARPS